MSERGKQVWDGVEADPDFQVVFVRHAESQINIIPELEIPRHALPPDYGVTYPLTVKGMGQAQAIGEKLADTRIQAIYSSVRTRCIQTATAIALPHRQSLLLSEEVVEIAFTEPDSSMGTIDETNVREVMARWLHGDIEAASPGGESLAQVFDRFLPWAHRTIGMHAGTPGTLVVVAHGGIMAAGLPQLFANVPSEYGMTNRFDNTQTASGRFVNGRLVCIDWRGESMG